PLPYQGSALPTELHGPRFHPAPARRPLLGRSKIMTYGAGNGTRTRDPELGRLALYQLSYSRSPSKTLQRWWRGEESNLRRLRRQIYSLLPLTTREPLRNSTKA